MRSPVHKSESAGRGKIQTALNDACPSSKRDKEKADFCIVYTAGDLGSLTCETNGGYALITDVKSRLAFTRPRCLAADLELASVDFATVEAQPVCGGEETFTTISSNITHNPFGLGMKQMTAMPVCVDVKPPP